MNELVIASNNAGKILEIRSMLERMTIRSLRDIGFLQDIEEPFHTFEENAQVKAVTVSRFCEKPVLADDSGLCVAALNGQPGVFSARYAGEPQDEARNLRRLMKEMEGIEDRRAYYKAVLCLVREEQVYFFEGICHGMIARYPAGKGGFGYDPVFIPDGYRETFAQLPPGIKNRISHRGKALQQLLRFMDDRDPSRRDIIPGL